ncbi:hypothetical protein Q0590_36135 [Rhodocytophaga aerolata]|uniref:HEPN domain-containing protein n=1 Tax=Rhodocytophaga aerolata TaxID=455078 RepID=A0ABT8RI48_9BACT|nr:hypothetical protein [Rhodocytophaga aerolata]MDO1451760.1 hypothetical protein [Rhodocytophaga aerolata]
MSNIIVKYRGQELEMNPGWVHDIMFLLVREFERNPDVIEKYSLQEIIKDYKYFYSIPGDAFYDPTDFDCIFNDNPDRHSLFLITLGLIKESLLSDDNYLTLQDIEGTVDIGTKFVGDKIDKEKLIKKIEAIEDLLNNRNA